MREQEQQPQEETGRTELSMHGPAPRRELTDLQAQLLALVITIGLTALFVLVFSLLTGSL
jgi:hypothetical protein